MAPEFSGQLAAKVYDQGELLRRITRFDTTKQWATAIKIPSFDEQSRADGSRFGGARAYWANEADSVTATRPKYRQIELSLKKLLATSYVTDELLADAQLLEQCIVKAFTNEFIFRLEDAIVNGDGSGKPLGVLKSGATIQVSKQSGQSSGSIVLENVTET